MPYGSGLPFARPPKYWFSPPSIPGLVAWYRADMGVTIGTGVVGWADQSGTGDANKNLGQGNPPLQPAFNASDANYNGKPTLGFATISSNYMASSVWSLSLPQPYSAFVVGNGDGAAANEYFTDGVVLDSGDMLATNTTNSKPALYAGTLLSGGVSTGAPMVMGADFNGASSAMYQNAVTAAATGNAGTSNRTGLIIGCAANVSGGFLNGRIAEIVIYSSVISAAQRSQLFSYFGFRYAISIGP